LYRLSGCRSWTIRTCHGIYPFTVTDIPKTRYARSADVSIAYQVVGDGPLDLVQINDWTSPLEARWEQPVLARPLRRLASFSRLIAFDKRGVGSSDPVPLDVASTLEEWVDDVRVVMDTVGSEKAALFAANEAGAVAMMFAATHPERVSALALACTTARLSEDDDYPGWDASFRDLMLGSVRNWGTSATEHFVAPSVAHDDRLVRWLGTHRRLQASPATAQAMLRMLVGLDVRHVLPSIQAPTLLIHRTDDRFAPVSNFHYLAKHIRNARALELPGEDNWWWARDSDVIVDEIQEFLTGVRHEPTGDRVLTTVLFTDIVDSTSRAAQMGDRRWRQALDEYDGLVARELERSRGRQIKTTGDGTLATFDGPARAIRCACAIRDAVRSFGLDLRSGLHTGEVELRGDDVAGLAVVIGSRVSALAESGEVIVSRTVVDLVAGSGIEFEDRGEHELKGVPGHWQLFAALGP
jgi:class 3 adenylate cyclase